MKRNYDFNFESKELTDYRRKIEADSKEMIQNLITKHSPIQKGEDVTAQSFSDKYEMVRVTNIKLMAEYSWGGPGERLSFEYEGIPLGQNGEPMKNRKPKWFGSFIKNNEWYHCPSYLRVQIGTAKIHDK